MISQHGWFSEETSAQRHAWRIELWEMHLYHIVLNDEFCGEDPKRGCQDAFAAPRCHRHADDLHTIHHLLTRQRSIILRGHHSNLMTASSKRARESFGIDRKPGCMRAIVSEHGQDFHKRG